MIYILLFINAVSITSGNLYINKFYSFMDNDKVLKFEIIITHSQFDSDYISKGDFYLVENNHYVFDTKLKRLIFNNDQIVTLNKADRQILYENKISETFSIFDIFRSKNELIETSKFELIGQEVEIYFNIKELSSSGSMIINATDGSPKLIKVSTEDNINIELKIESVTTSSKLELKNIDTSQFSLIDLRG